MASPLLDRKLEDLEADARRFWMVHNQEDRGLEQLVTKDEFVRSVLCFRNLHDTLEAVNHFEDPTLPISRIGARGFVKRLETLPLKDRTAIRWYFAKPTASPAGNIVKRGLIRVIDWIHDTIWKPANPEAKSNWDHIKTLSRAHMTVLATCIFAATTQGWDQASMNGANIQWPADLGVDIIRFRDDPTMRDVLIFSWLNAAPFFSGAIIGTFITDPLINMGHFGRRWAIVVAGLFSLCSVVAAAFVKTWEELMVCRILLGIGMGAKATTVPIYISEIAPEQIRGMLAMSWQLFDTFGILVGSITNLVVFLRNQDHPQWRFMIGLPFIPALLFLTLALFCVESPRWLLKRNKMAEALKALIDLHGLPSSIVACGELYLTFSRLKEEEVKYERTYNDHPLVRWATSKSPLRGRSRKGTTTGNLEMQNVDSSGNGNTATTTGDPESTDPVQRPAPELDPPMPSNTQSSISSERERLMVTGWWKRVRLLILVPRMRNAVWASMCVMIAQQACGINILAFLSATMYNEVSSGQDTGVSITDCLGQTTEKCNIIHEEERARVHYSLLFTVYFGLTNFIGTWVAIPLVDRFGRRVLLKVSFPCMAACLIFVGGFLNLQDPRHRINCFRAFTLIFTFVFSIGEGPTAFVISSEVFPLVVRELGMSHAVFHNFFWASVLSFLVPIMAKSAQSGWFWFIFAGFNIIFWRVSCLVVQGTSNEALENIDQEYSKPKMEALKKMTEYKIIMAIKGKWHGEQDKRNVSSGAGDPSLHLPDDHAATVAAPQGPTEPTTFL